MLKLAALVLLSVLAMVPPAPVFAFVNRDDCSTNSDPAGWKVEAQQIEFYPIDWHPAAAWNNQKFIEVSPEQDGLISVNLKVEFLTPDTGGLPPKLRITGVGDGVSLSRPIVNKSYRKGAFQEMVIYRVSPEGDSSGLSLLLSCPMSQDDSVVASWTQSRGLDVGITFAPELSADTAKFGNLTGKISALGHHNLQKTLRDIVVFNTGQDILGEWMYSPGKLMYNGKYKPYNMSPIDFIEKKNLGRGFIWDVSPAMNKIPPFFQITYTIRNNIARRNNAVFAMDIEQRAVYAERNWTGSRVDISRMKLTRRFIVDFVSRKVRPYQEGYDGTLASEDLIIEYSTDGYKYQHKDAGLDLKYIGSWGN